MPHDDLPSHPDTGHHTGPEPAAGGPTSQARVATDRASRYLAQLCEHGGKMKHLSLQRLRSHGGNGGPPVVRHAERSSDTDGVIDFGWGRCVLRATGTELLLRAEADDEPQLRRIEDGVAARVQRIGRRDGLSVTWTRSDGSD